VATTRAFSVQEKRAAASAAAAEDVAALEAMLKSGA
jgi:hypothetical protein